MKPSAEQQRSDDAHRRGQLTSQDLDVTVETASRNALNMTEQGIRTAQRNRRRELVRRYDDEAQRPRLIGIEVLRVVREQKRRSAIGRSSHHVAILRVRSYKCCLCLRVGRLQDRITDQGKVLLECGEGRQPARGEEVRRASSTTASDHTGRYSPPNAAPSTNRVTAALNRTEASKKTVSIHTPPTATEIARHEIATWEACVGDGHNASGEGAM